MAIKKKVAKKDKGKTIRLINNPEGEVVEALLHIAKKVRAQGLKSSTIELRDIDYGDERVSCVEMRLEIKIPPA